MASPIGRYGSSKFSKPAKDPPQMDSPASDPECQSCGWNFPRDNAALRQQGKMLRTEPRTQINIKRHGLTITRCSDCFKRELLNTKGHTKSGTEGEGLYRQGLK